MFQDQLLGSQGNVHRSCLEPAAACRTAIEICSPLPQAELIVFFGADDCDNLRRLECIAPAPRL